jgi:DNA repair protein RadC
LNSVDYIRDPAGGPRSAPSLVTSASALREGRGHELSDLDLLTLLLGPGKGSGAHAAAATVFEAGGWTSLLKGGQGASWWDRLRPTQALRLASSLELSRRLGTGTGVGAAYVRTPQDVYEVTADLRTLRREHFMGLYLNTRNRLLARETISVGSLNAAIVHPREVFEPAVRRGAASVVVVHNHPSGEPDPSEDDINITRRLDEAGNILGISLMDHVIVTAGGYTSLKEADLL